MGTLVGHVAPGLGFVLIGLWHLFNNIKLHSLQPNSYTSPPWFPSRILRHLELILIIAGSTLSIAMDLFIGPENHHPLDPADWTIPSNHLHNFEHASISLAFLVYAALSILLDRKRPQSHRALTHLLAAVAFAQQLFMFHLHYADHMGVEGLYHRLLQLVIAVSLSTTLAGIGLPGSFAVSFVRSVSIMFQGLWFVVMGYMLWTPALIFKGCFMHPEDGHTVVRCDGRSSLDRAKSLVNLQFSWFLTGVVIFSVVFYLFLTKRYPDEPEYVALGKGGSDEEEEDLESQKRLQESESFVHIGKGMSSVKLER